MNKTLLYPVILFLFIYLSAFSNIIDIKTNAEGNVFFEGDEILINFIVDRNNTSFNEIEYKIFDLFNKQIRVKKINNPEILSKINTVKNEDNLTTGLLELKLDKLPAGYYTLGINFKNNRGKNEEHYIKFAVIRKTVSDKSADSPFAIDAFLSWRFKNENEFKTAANLISKAGIEWIRDRIEWEHVEPVKGNWNYSGYDASQKIQAGSGLKILQIYHGTAPWASEKKVFDKEICKKFPPENLYDLYNFMDKSVSRYKNYVNAWEMWNEFDIPVFFMGKADEYSEILKTSYLAIKQNNPDKLALFGSVTFGTGLIQWGDESYIDDEGEKYIRKVFENGAVDYFDIFNVHHYGPVYGIVDKIRRCKNILKKYDCYKPIWITEVGSASTKKMARQTDKTEIEQSAYLVKSYIMAISEGVSKIFYFSFPLFIEHGISNWGIFEIDENKWQPKPSYSAMANMVNTLYKADFKGKLINSNKNIYGYIFENEKDTILTVWAADNTSPALKLSEKMASNLICRSICGADIKNAKNKKNELMLTGTPVYLIFKGHNIFSGEEILFDDDMKWEPKDYNNDKILKEIVLNLRYEPGKINQLTEKITCRMGIYSFLDKDIEGKAEIILNVSGIEKNILTTNIKLNKRENQFVNFEFKPNPEIKEKLRSGEEVFIKSAFTDNASKKVSSPCIKYLEFENVINFMQASLLSETGKSSSLKVKFKADSSLKGKGIVQLEKNPENYAVVSQTLHKIEFPGEDKIFEIPFKFVKTSDANYPETNSLTYSVSFNNNKLYRDELIEYDKVFNTNEFYYSNGSPECPYNFVGGMEKVVHGNEVYKGLEDSSGYFQVFCDYKEETFIIWGIFCDDFIMNDYPDESPWTGDAVELFIDVRDKGKLGTKSYDDKVYQIFIIPPTGDSKESVYKVWQPASKKNIPLYVECYTKEKNGLFYYALFASIRWKDLGINKIEPGMQIGFDLVLDDMDRNDYEHVQLSWRGGSNNWRDPSLFSRLNLSDGEDKK